MAIPESQLETWSHQGSVTQSSATYNSIRNVLKAVGSPYSDKPYSVFLQGSYGNDTNIYAESDVDIVIKLDGCWQSDLEALTPEDKEAYKKAHVDATYTHVHLKRDVLKVLTDAYGAEVQAGAKAIAIAAQGGRRKADVISAIQFRRYYKFKGIANYPKQHSMNLTRKHQGSNNRLKPMIRVLKNIRSKLVDDGSIKGGVAPSYYLEGLLYNVPSDKFVTSLQDSFVNAIDWIQREADKSKLVCANEQYFLLRDTHMLAERELRSVP
jgi:hypothetical protein